MRDIVDEMQRKREAWERAEERYQCLLAAEATGNIKSPPMSGMPSGGFASDKTEKLFLDIDQARIRADRLKREYLEAKELLMMRLRKQFDSNRDFKIVWQYIVERENAVTVAKWNHVSINVVYKLKNKYKKAVAAEI